jgi:hypothetical protein
MAPEPPKAHPAQPPSMTTDPERRRRDTGAQEIRPGEQEDELEAFQQGEEEERRERRQSRKKQERRT